MKKGRKKKKWFVLTIIAFLLHGLWEYAQCLYFYDMESWKFGKITLWMWMAVAGDVIITLILIRLVMGPCRSWSLHSRDWRKWIKLLSSGAVTGFFLEWMALKTELWKYTASMPMISFLGFGVGLVPLLQMTLLPSVIFGFTVVLNKQ